MSNRQPDSKKLAQRVTPSIMDGVNLKAVENGAPSGFATPGNHNLYYTPAILGSKIGPGGNNRVGSTDLSRPRDSASFGSPHTGHELPSFV